MLELQECTITQFLQCWGGAPAWQQAFHPHFYKFTESRFPKPLTKEATPHETRLSGRSLRSRVPKGRVAKALFILVHKTLGSLR